MSVWTRVYPLRKQTKKSSPPKRKRKGWKPQLAVWYGQRDLIFDHETRDEQGQRLLFGSYQIRDHGEPVEIALIEGESLTRDERRKLRRAARKFGLRILTRDRFAKIMRAEIQQIGTICVGHNIAFDASRSAHGWAECNGRNTGAFNLYMERNTYRPYLRVKHRNRRSSIIKYVPGNKTEVPKPHHAGYFIDTRTLIAALTDESMTLEQATVHYDTPTKKKPAKRHGVINDKYVKYNLDDVQATWEVYRAAMADYHQLGLRLPAHLAVSTATIGKAHLDRMGIKPRLEHQPDFPIMINGFAMEAYFGGRVEGHWPNEEQPVTYLDVLSMYPTVFVLQGLWWWVVAGRLQPYECTDDVRRFVDEITIEQLMHPSTWLFMPKLVLVEPRDDLVPVRGDYACDGDLQIGLNHLTADDVHWMMLADVVGSKLRTGRTPTIVRAIGIETVGHQPGLKPMKIRVIKTIDPDGQDFFAEIINQRVAHKARTGLKTDQDKALYHFLKIIANSTAYGIFAEFNEERLSKEELLDVYAGEHFQAQSPVFEKAGRFCFPLIASVVTGAARLILTLVELQAAKLGASYAMCDTDSIAVVDPDRTIGDRLAAAFESLNPYDFKGSILKVEDENFHPDTGKRIPLFALVKASKKYCLYNIDPKSGRPIIRKALEHGLGHLQPPEGETRESWVEKFWYYLVCRAKGIACRQPRWFHQIALAQLAISTPNLIHPFHASKVEQLSNGGWPFNFMLVGYPKEPAGASGWCRKHKTDSIGCRDTSPCRFRYDCPLVKPIRAVTPFKRDVEQAELLPWIDAHTGAPIIVDPPGAPSGIAGHVSLKTYGDIYDEFIDHIDRKAAMSNGAQAEPGYKGELRPLHIYETDRKYTGKEARDIEISEVFGDTDRRYIVYDQGWPALRAQFPAAV